MQKRVNSTFDLAHLMCSAADVNLYTTVMVADITQEVLAFRSGWSGGIPNRPSMSPFIGRSKASELLQTMDPATKFAMTPTPGFDLGCGYMGGVRRENPDSDPVQFITSGSAWAQKCDAMFALVLNYAMSNEVLFHHVGFRHSSEEELLRAVAFDENRIDVVALEVPAEDHRRFYLKVKNGPGGVHWIEHQYFPVGNHNPVIHWDVTTPNPMGLLEFVGTSLGIPIATWTAGKNDPVGAVSERNVDGVTYKFMARPHWWTIN